MIRPVPSLDSLSAYFMSLSISFPDRSYYYYFTYSLTFLWFNVGFITRLRIIIFNLIIIFDGIIHIFLSHNLRFDSFGFLNDNIIFSICLIMEIFCFRVLESLENILSSLVVENEYSTLVNWFGIHHSEVQILKELHITEAFTFVDSQNFFGFVMCTIKFDCSYRNKVY